LLLNVCLCSFGETINLGCGHERLRSDMHLVAFIHAHKVPNPSLAKRLSCSCAECGVFESCVEVCGGFMNLGRFIIDSSCLV
jgi:hypothetical protein